MPVDIHCRKEDLVKSVSKKAVYILIASILLTVAGYFVVAAAFPKELSRFPVFVLILLLDLYLWLSLRKMVRAWSKPWKWLFTAFYWLPFILVVAMGITSVFVNLYLMKPHLATYGGGVIFIIYAAKLVTILFFLLADLYSILRHAIRFAYHKKKKKPCPENKPGITRAKFLRNLGLAGGGLVLSGLIIGAVRWAYDFRLRREYLSFPGLPDNIDGLKMIQISDLHLGSWTDKNALQEVVEVINDEDPDFIFFTGDLVNFLTREAYRYQDVLEKLEARNGVYAILGNHDYGDYVRWDDEGEKDRNMRELEDLYKNMGWQLLRNENRILSYNDVPVSVIGVENWSTYDRFPSHGDLDKARQGIGNEGFKVLLSHDPTHWDAVVSREHPDIHLTLSGHTHGFQFGVELKNFRWSPAQYMYKRWAGLYRNDAIAGDQYLYVNRGLGMIGYPGRIGILPEITVLELTA